MFREALYEIGAPPSRASDTTPIAKLYLETGWGEAYSRFHRLLPKEHFKLPTSDIAPNLSMIDKNKGLTSYAVWKESKGRSEGTRWRS